MAGIYRISIWLDKNAGAHFWLTKYPMGKGIPNKAMMSTLPRGVWGFSQGRPGVWYHSDKFSLNPEE